MARRFGRNQKRKMRESINFMEIERNQAKAEAMIYKSRADNAATDAFKRYAENSGMIERAIQNISYELGRALTTDNTKAAAELSVRLRKANALIDTLVARLIASNYLLKVAMKEGAHDGWMPTAGASLNLNEQALAEAKKRKGEV